MSKYSVKKPFTVFVGVVLVLILGFVSFTSMTTDLLPAMELPYVAILTTSIGDSPEKIEKSVTKPLEQQLATTSGIKEIQSISSENVSMIIMEFYDSIDMNSTVIDISSKIDLANLDDKIPNPTIMQINPTMMPILVGAVDMDNEQIQEVSDLASEKIIPAIERIDGVASVTTTGLIENSIAISLNQGKIDELNTKILNQVDSQLAKTKSQLDQGEQQLSKAKKELRIQEAGQSSQLIMGELQLSNMISLLQLGQSGITTSTEAINKTITSLKQQITEGEAENQDVTILRQALQTAQQSYDNLIVQQTSLQTKLDTLNQQSTQLTMGQEMLNSQLAEAYEKIEIGQAQIIQGKLAFDTASQPAYQAAGLTSALSKNSINQILTAQNMAMPAGYIEVDNVATLIKVGDEFESIEEIKDLVLVDQVNLGTITLKDIADIQEVNNIGENYAKINGNDGLLFTVQKQSTASTSTVSKLIQEEVSKLQDQYQGLHITSLNDQGSYIDIVIDSVLNNLISGGLLAAVILYFFLKNIKTTIITAFSIPVSLLFALVAMYFSGVTLNIISLAGLALGVGMLVDNSIVVVENIYRLKAEGKEIKQAAITGAKQMAGAIIASTLTTVCVFLPIVFTDGIAKQLFTDMGLTIAYSLIASLIIALTLVPAMSSMMLDKTKDKKNYFLDRIISYYQKMLAFCLNKKAFLLIGVCILFAISCFSVINMGTEFIPDMDSEMISVSLTGDKELSEVDFQKIVDKTTPLVEQIKGVKTVGVMQGGTMLSSMSASGNAMNMYIILDENRDDTSQEIATKINNLETDKEINLVASGSTMDMSALMGSGIQIVIKGQDLEKLLTVSDEIKELVSKVDGIDEVTNGQEENNQEVVLTVDKNMAMKHQLTVAQVYAEVAGLLKSSINSIEITKEDGDIYPIVIKEVNNKISVDDIKNHEIAVNQEKIKIGDIVTVSTQNSMKAINHLQQSRTITVDALLKDNANIGIVGKKVAKVINDYKIDDGYSIEIQGENEVINSTMNDLIKMIALAIVFIYLIMVAQFQSLKSPFIVIFTLPLAFTGGLLALLFTNNYLSMIAMLGFLILSGIVVNNGIVFVDCINQLKAEGMLQKEAILLTGKLRIRPIIMTALTTILGLSTMAMGIGAGADMLAPMAIVTIGGLAYATLLTLFVVPCIYDLINYKKRTTNNKNIY